MSQETGNYDRLKKPYMHKSKGEWDEFLPDFVALLSLKKNKLDSVMTQNKLHRVVTKRETKECGLRDARLATHLEETLD